MSELSHLAKLQRDLKYVSLSKKSPPEITLCDILGKARLWRSRLPGMGGGGVNRQKESLFRAAKILHMIL